MVCSSPVLNRSILLIVLVLLFGTARSQSPCDPNDSLSIEKTAFIQNFIEASAENNFSEAFPMIDHILENIPCASHKFYAHAILLIQDSIRNSLRNTIDHNAFAQNFAKIYEQWRTSYPENTKDINSLFKQHMYSILSPTDSDRMSRLDLITFKLNSIIESSAFIYNTDSLMSTLVETPPEFPGGTKALVRFLSKNYNYPRIAVENNVEGRIYISFVVNRDGSIVDVKLLQGLCPPCDKEAIRLVKSMPKWEPGYQEGKAVRVQFNLPISLELVNPRKRKKNRK